MHGIHEKNEREERGGSYDTGSVDMSETYAAKNIIQLR